MFRPLRTTVLLGIAAEPVEKPDARLLALDSNRALIPVSQRISPDHRGGIMIQRPSITVDGGGVIDRFNGRLKL